MRFGSLLESKQTLLATLWILDVLVTYFAMEDGILMKRLEEGIRSCYTLVLSVSSMKVGDSRGFDLQVIKRTTTVVETSFLWSNFSTSTSSF